MSDKEQQRAIAKTLRDTFGYRRLRAGQQEVIGSVLAKHDTLAVMPTGAGKSLCYQLPALLMDGVTLVGEHKVARAFVFDGAGKSANLAGPKSPAGEPELTEPRDRAGVLVK